MDGGDCGRDLGMGTWVLQIPVLGAVGTLTTMTAAARVYCGVEPQGMSFGTLGPLTPSE